MRKTELKVKPLKWEFEEKGKVPHAVTPVGMYAIYKCTGKYEGRFNPCLGGRGIYVKTPCKTCGSLEEAVQAVELDFKSRILSSLL